jgi:hypothetical protein
VHAIDRNEFNLGEIGELKPATVGISFFCRQGKATRVHLLPVDFEVHNNVSKESLYG